MAATTSTTRPTSVVLRLGATRSLTITVGSVVLIRDGEDDSYGAVVSSLDGGCVRLTFTPEGKPRRVPMGMVLCTMSEKCDSVDPKSVPRFQPPPTGVPRRRKGERQKRQRALPR